MKANSFDTEKSIMLHNAVHFVTGEDKEFVSDKIWNACEIELYRMLLDSQHFRSFLLHRSTRYHVLLPAQYESSTTLYPVLYLLHGLFGQCDNWLEFTNIAELATALDLVVVMPDGSDSWYCDSATVASEKYESFVLDEFIPHIERKYRVNGDRQSRAIAGLSMGGYGAFKFAAKRPDIFEFAASLSGAFDVPRMSDESPGFDWQNLRPSVLKAFGEAQSTNRDRNDLHEIFMRMPSDSIQGLPFFYFDCGLSDGFLAANLRLEQLLRGRGISHRFSALQGGHDWEYWGSRLPTLFSLAKERLWSPS
jgi:S-formylglutathione hydrolase FrmB